MFFWIPYSKEAVAELNRVILEALTSSPKQLYVTLIPSTSSQTKRST